MPVNPKDAPVGHIAVSSVRCDGCTFEFDDDCGTRNCTPARREDGEHVAFVRDPGVPTANSLLLHAQALAAAARAAGLVLTIEQAPTPGEPLAMGRHVDVVTVREER